MFKNHPIFDIFDYICTHNKYRYEHTDKIQEVYLAGEHHPQST